MGSIVLSGLKERLNEPGSESDAALQQVLDAARQYFARHAGRSLASPPVPHSVELFSAGGNALHLPDSFASISAVYVRSSLSQTWSLLDSAGWAYDSTRAPRVLYRVGAQWPSGGSYLVRVDGTVGYASGQIPDDWCEAVYALAAHWWTDARRAGGAIPPELSERGNALPRQVLESIRAARGLPVGL